MDRSNHMQQNQYLKWISSVPHSMRFDLHSHGLVKAETTVFPLALAKAIDTQDQQEHFIPGILKEYDANVGPA